MHKTVEESKANTKVRMFSSSISLGILEEMRSNAICKSPCVLD